MAWPEDLLEMVDKEAGRQGMNRSQYVRLAVARVLAQDHSVDVVPLPDEPAVLGMAAPHRR